MEFRWIDPYDILWYGMAKGTYLANKYLIDLVYMYLDGPHYKTIW